MDGYKIVSVINKNVRIIESVHDGKKYALKSVINTEPEQGIESGTVCELSVLGSAHHNNVMSMIDAFPDTTKRIVDIVLPLAVEDLLSFIKRESGVRADNEPFAQVTMFHQALCGLNYLHINKIIHNDIKPANILVFEDRCVKLADFGLSKCITMISTNDTLSLSQSGWYRPLELFNYYDDSVNPRHSYESDIWAMGLTFYNLATGHLIGDDDDVSYRTIIMTIVIFLVSQWSDHPRFSGELTALPSLIKSMIAVEKSKRVSSSDALNHDVFRAQQLDCLEKPHDYIPPEHHSKRHIDEYTKFRSCLEDFPVSPEDIHAVNATAHHIFNKCIDAFSGEEKIDPVAIAAASISSKLHEREIEIGLGVLVRDEDFSLFDLECRMLKHLGWSISTFA